MTDLRKAAEMALDVLLDPKTRADEVADAVKAIRQALAPTKLPSPDEPIWVVDEKGNKQLLAKQNRAQPKSYKWELAIEHNYNSDGTLRSIKVKPTPQSGWVDYEPPKREWVGLTVNEAREFYEKYTNREELIYAIDKFLEEKNT